MFLIFLDRRGGSGFDAVGGLNHLCLRGLFRLSEFVDQCELGRRFTRKRGPFIFGHAQIARRSDGLRLFLHLLPRLLRSRDIHRWRSAVRDVIFDGGNLCRFGFDQGEETGIGASTEALQYDLAGTGRRFGTAVLQGFVSRFVEDGFGKTVKAAQRSRGFAGGDELALLRECRDRRVDALDQVLQSLDQRHRTANRLRGHDQDALAATGQIEPRTPAGDEHAKRRPKTAQALEPDRFRRRQPVGELRQLPPVLVRGSEDFPGEACAIGRTEDPRAEGIRPQDARAVAGPEPCGQRARCMQRQSWIAEASQLEFRGIHRVTGPTRFGCLRDSLWWQGDDARTGC